MSDFTNDNMIEENGDYGYTNRIAMIREKENLTQSQFAEKVGISIPLVSDIERKNKRLSIRNAIEISNIFNVSLDWLYELNDDTRDPAGIIIDNLKSVFDIDLEKKTISIEKELAEFIQKLSQAYKTKEGQNIPNEAFKYWIEGIKKEYNEKTKITKETKNFEKYYLQSSNEHDEEEAERAPGVIPFTGRRSSE